MKLHPVWIAIAVVSITLQTSALNTFADETSKKSAAETSTESTKDQPKAKESKKPTDPLLEQVEKAISISSRRYLTAGVHTPWQIMHGVLALRRDFKIKKDGKKISALQWLAEGASYQGAPMFEVTEYGGRARPYTQPYAFEGHPNQFLAILTISNLARDHKFQAGDGTITMADMVKNAQMVVNSNEEITWTLWALSHYLSPQARWTNYYGEQWSIEDLVRIQTNESTSDAACGGTHGLFALTYARNKFLGSKKPMRGVWIEADQKIKRYIEHARSLQNEDGSFSASFFDGAQYTYDFTERLASSGHTLEWLMLALPKARLKEAWVRRGVSAVAKDLIDHRSEPIDCGPLYHALHSLVLYRNHLKPPSKTSLAQKVAKAVKRDKNGPAKQSESTDGQSSAETPKKNTESKSSEQRTDE